MAKAVENKVAALIGEKVDAAGYDLVRVQVMGGGKYSTLQIMAERKDGLGMKVEDCTLISRILSPIVEADPELADRYDLEVSSPGIDRPLVKLKDYEKFVGHLAKVELNADGEGRRRFQGVVRAVSADAVEFDVAGEVVGVLFDDIDRAKLVLTDELLKAAAAGQVSH